MNRKRNEFAWSLRVWEGRISDCLGERMFSGGGQKREGGLYTIFTVLLQQICSLSMKKGHSIGFKIKPQIIAQFKNV